MSFMFIFYSKGHFRMFRLKNVACDLVFIQIDVFDGHMMFFFTNIRYIVGVFRHFLNIGQQNTNVYIYFRG
jgi:hypothetical protein